MHDIDYTNTMTQQQYYTFKITPITETTCELKGFIEFGEEYDENNFLAAMPSYIGDDYHYTPNELIIDSAILNGVEYDIISIDATSFSHCSSLETIIISNKVKSIKWNMYKCSSLKNIIVEKDNPYYYDIDGVLFQKKTLIAFPQGRIGTYKIPNGIKKIGSHAFKSCRISKVIFPHSLQEIGQNAFYECNNIKEFILPPAIKKVHRNDNVNNTPITQDFYLSSDSPKGNPLKISDITKMFPV